MNRHFYFLMMLALLLFTGCQDALNYEQKIEGQQPESRNANVPFVHPNDGNVFDLTALPTVKVTVPVDQWNDLLLAYDADRGDNYWIHSDFEFTKNGVVTTLPDVALRVRGNSSRNRPEGSGGQLHDSISPVWNQCSFSVNFGKYDKTQTLEGLSKLRLKYVREDPTRIREVYSFNLHKLDDQFTAPRVSFCRFYIHIEGDEEPAYFGIYKLMENIDEDYIKNRADYFGDNAKGFLWKGDNDSDMKDPDRNLMGESTADDPKRYDLKINAKRLTEAQDELIDFITNLNTLTGDSLKAWAEEIMDVNLFLRTYAINVMCGNVDDYWVNSNNYNFYFNREGKFFFIPNDYDTTLGTFWDVVPDVGRQDVLNWGGDNPLVRNLLTIPEFNQLYVQAFHDLAAGPFNVNNSIPRIQTWQNLIEPYLADDTTDETPFEDTPAFWSANQDYRLLERGANNYFEVRSSTLPPLAPGR